MDVGRLQVRKLGDADEQRTNEDNEKQCCHHHAGREDQEKDRAHDSDYIIDWVVGK